MIGTIEAEAAACRKRFKGVKEGALVRCLRHKRLCEILTEPIENRITYIISEKAEHERARRLYEMRPILGSDSPEWNALVKAWDALAKARVVKARDAYGKVWDALDKAQAALDKAWVAYLSTHRQQIIDMVPDTSWDGWQLQFETQ